MVLFALSSYIRALCDNCEKTMRPVTVNSQLDRVEQVLMLLEPGKIALSADVKHLLVASARHQLGLIHERYIGPDLSRQRKAIKNLSFELMQIQQNLAKETGEYHPQLSEVREGFVTLRKDLVRLESRSLYNPKRLARAVQ
ncbi:MAG: hypothetical protein AAGM33_02115 [Pseudomonadota bacterium]